MKSYSEWGFLSPVKDTVSQSHQSDKGLLPSSGFTSTGPLRTANATRWSVRKEFWIPTFFLGVQQLRFSKSQKVTGPEWPWNWGGFHQLLSVSWEIPGYRFSSVIMKHYRKILQCQHNLSHLRGFCHSYRHLLHWGISGGNRSYTTCILLVSVVMTARSCGNPHFHE